MHKLLPLFILLYLISCSPKNSSPAETGLQIDSIAHKVTVWVNNEPAFVHDPRAGKTFSVKPIRFLFKKGQNHLRFTLEKLPDYDPKKEPSFIRVKEGSWAEPDKIKTHLDLEFTKDHDSHEWAYNENEGFVKSFENFEKNHNASHRNY